MAVSFSWSRAGDQRPQTTASKASATANAKAETAQAVPVMDQLQRVRDAWDPRSPNCAFQHYFYNKVPADQAPYYTMPPGQDPAKWEAALAARPDATSVPVLAVGFNDLSKRVQQQHQQVNAYRVRMHEINEKLTEMQNRHDLRTTVKLAEMRERHIKLARRVLALAVKLQVLTHRGEALSPDEELFRRKLHDYIKQADDPSVFGSLNEVWARVKVAAQRINKDSAATSSAIDAISATSSVSVTTSASSDQTGQNNGQDPGPGGIDWRRDSDELERIVKVLAAHQTGIQFLASLLQQDEDALSPSSGDASTGPNASSTALKGSQSSTDSPSHLNIGGGHSFRAQ